MRVFQVLRVVFVHIYTRREQVCTANNEQACVHRRFSFANEQRRKENADEEGCFARKRERFAEIQAEQTGHSSENGGRNGRRNLCRVCRCL